MCISASPNRDALFLCPDFIGGIPIRKRNNRVVVHLNDAELSKLEQDTATAGMCREKYIRLALMGIIIHPRPPDNYGKVLQQLSAYGNNLNQIAHVVNATGRATAEQLDTALQILEKTWDYVEDQQTRRRLTLDLKPGSGSSNLQTSAKIQRIKICTRPLRRLRPRR